MTCSFSSDPALVKALPTPLSEEAITQAWDKAQSAQHKAEERERAPPRAKDAQGRCLGSGFSDSFHCSLTPGSSSQGPLFLDPPPSLHTKVLQSLRVLWVQGRTLWLCSLPGRFRPAFKIHFQLMFHLPFWVLSSFFSLEHSLYLMSIHLF